MARATTEQIKKLTPLLEAAKAQVKIERLEQRCKERIGEVIDGLSTEAAKLLGAARS